MNYVDLEQLARLRAHLNLTPHDGLSAIVKSALDLVEAHALLKGDVSLFRDRVQSLRGVGTPCLEQFACHNLTLDQRKVQQLQYQIEELKAQNSRFEPFSQN